MKPESIPIDAPYFANRASERGAIFAGSLAKSPRASDFSASYRAMRHIGPPAINAHPTERVAVAKYLATQPFDLGVHVRQFVDEAQTGLFVLDGATQRLLYANPFFAVLCGRSANELIGALVFDLVAPEDRDLVERNLRRRLQGEVIAPYEVRGLRNDGTVFDALVSANKIEIEGRVADLVTVSDLTEYKRVEQENRAKTRKLARLELLGGAALFDVEFPEKKLVASAGLRELLGIPGQGVVSWPLDACTWIPPSDLAYVSAFWRNAIPNEPFEFQHGLIRADSKQITVRHRGLLEAQGESCHGIGFLENISAQVDAEHRVQELTYRDEVTGLPNRTSLRGEIAVEMNSVRRNLKAGQKRIFHLLVIQVPKILELNSVLGYGAGETLAMTIATRLKNACSEQDRLARIAETEFAVLPDPERAYSSDALFAYAQGLRTALQQPAIIGTGEVGPRCTIGITEFSGTTDNPSALLEEARMACLQAARDGFQGISFFGDQGSERMLRSIAIESALPQVVKNQELRLLYQPVIDLTNGQIVTVEALLRWNSPRFGQVSPTEFIPLAERSDTVLEISDWVMREACRQAAAWRSAKLRVPRIAINVSPRQLNRPDFAARVQAITLECDCDPSWLGLEVTESALIEDERQAVNVLADLKATGFEIALDDFGTGHSSLSRLHQLPVDVVKIDRSLIPDVLVSPETASITRAIITMSHSLKLRVLAEGVETEDQLKLLATNGCDLIQGYYFSGPVAPEAIETMLCENRGLPEQFLRRPKADRTLLLVDDEENILSSLRRLLRKEGYRIVVAHSAAEALKCLTETRVDVILSDQRMPGMTGVEFLRHAKDLYPDTIRMVLSGFTDLQTVIDAVNEGAIYKFLTKPWDDDKLRERVAEAFREKEMADENRRLAREVETANANLASLNERLKQAVSLESDHAKVLARAADGVRGILECLPAFIIGVDSEGLVAFVQGDPSKIAPLAQITIGLPANGLPPPLYEMLQQPDPGARAVEIGASRYLALRRAVAVPDAAQNHLIVLLPAEMFADALATGPCA